MHSYAKYTSIICETSSNHVCGSESLLTCYQYVDLWTWDICSSTTRNELGGLWTTTIVNFIVFNLSPLSFPFAQVTSTDTTLETFQQFQHGIFRDPGRNVVAIQFFVALQFFCGITVFLGITVLRGITIFCSILRYYPFRTYHDIHVSYHFIHVFQVISFVTFFTCPSPFLHLFLISRLSNIGQ